MTGHSERVTFGCLFLAKTCLALNCKYLGRVALRENRNLLWIEASVAGNDARCACWRGQDVANSILSYQYRS